MYSIVVNITIRDSYVPVPILFLQLCNANCFSSNVCVCEVVLTWCGTSNCTVFPSLCKRDMRLASAVHIG
jgi:hypothetical protein